MTAEEEKEKTKRVIIQVEIKKKLKIIGFVLLVGFFATLPITIPMFGGNAKDVADFVKEYLPLLGIGILVGLYRIYELVSMKKKLQEKLNGLENNNQEPEEEKERKL